MSIMSVLRAVIGGIHGFVERFCQSGAEPDPEAQRPAWSLGTTILAVVAVAGAVYLGIVAFRHL